jgi:predicted transcriptional regulator
LIVIRLAAISLEDYEGKLFPSESLKVTRGCLIVAVIEEGFDLRSKHLLKGLLEQPSVLFNRHRIAIMVELYHASAVDFSQLKHDLGLTDGALATYLRALASEGLTESKREAVESRLRTGYIITKKGILALEKTFEILCELHEGFQQ